MLLTLPPAARQDYFPLLSEPLLILEQLLINLKVDWAEVAVRTLRGLLVGQEAGFGADDIDKLLADYAGKALDFSCAPRERSRSGESAALRPVGFPLRSACERSGLPPQTPSSACRIPCCRARLTTPAPTHRGRWSLRRRLHVGFAQVIRTFSVQYGCSTFVVVHCRQHPHPLRVHQQLGPRLCWPEAALRGQVPAAGSAAGPERLGPRLSAGLVHGVPAGEVYDGEAAPWGVIRRFLKSYGGLTAPSVLSVQQAPSLPEMRPPGLSGVLRAPDVC